MKSKAKLLFIFFISLLICQSLFSATTDTKIPRKYRLAAYTKAVEKELGHKSEKYENDIINITYSYYGNACQNNWDKETWKEAITKAVELCKNKIAIAAAKAGEFGEKLLKALITTTKDAAESFSNWLDEKSQEYDESKKGNKDSPKTKQI